MNETLHSRTPRLKKRTKKSKKTTTRLFPFPVITTPYIRMIWSSVNFSTPESRCDHHSNSFVSQMSLNHGVMRASGSARMALSSSGVTYFSALTSLRLTLRSTLALMKRM